MKPSRIPCGQPATARQPLYDASCGESGQIGRHGTCEGEKAARGQDRMRECETCGHEKRNSAINGSGLNNGGALFSRHATMRVTAVGASSMVWGVRPVRHTRSGVTGASTALPVAHFAPVSVRVTASRPCAGAVKTWHRGRRASAPEGGVGGVDNQCPHQQVTTRTVPIDLYGEDGTPLYRIRQAQFKTCQACGASFYDPQEFLRPSADPIPTPAPPVEGDVYV